MAVTSKAAKPRSGDDRNLSGQLSELVALIVRYAKQETVDPLKALLRYLGFGVAGAVLLAFGVVLLALAGLRAVTQELSPHLDGNLSWVPYLVVVVVIGGLIGLLARAIGADKRRTARERVRLDPTTRPGSSRAERV